MDLWDLKTLLLRNIIQLHLTVHIQRARHPADLLVNAYHDTFNLPTVITRCSNNYGAYQFPEKLIPLMIHNIQEDKPLPVYGDGSNIRDWIYVEDHCRGIYKAMTEGQRRRSL